VPHCVATLPRVIVTVLIDVDVVCIVKSWKAEIIRKWICFLEIPAENSVIIQNSRQEFLGWRIPGNSPTGIPDSREFPVDLVWGMNPGGEKEICLCIFTVVIL